MHQEVVHLEVLNRKMQSKEISPSQALTSLARARDSNSVAIPASGVSAKSGDDSAVGSNANPDIMSLSTTENVQKHSKYGSPTPTRPGPPPRRNSEAVLISVARHPSVASPIVDVSAVQ